MLIKTIKYTDFNGVERSEEYCFHITDTEITEMSLSINGGLDKMLGKIINTDDHAKLVSIFKDLILKSYGEKSFDGKQFRKFDEEGRPLSREFSQTSAYNSLFMELATNPEAALQFIQGILPANISNDPGFKKEVNVQMSKLGLANTTSGK